MQQLTTLCFLLFLGFSSCKILYAGVNQAGADFAPEVWPGIEGHDYDWPTQRSLDYFVSKGMNIFRVPFIWERMQPTLNGEFAAAYIADLDATVNYITNTKKVYALLDVHNYLGYRGVKVGNTQVPYTALKSFWKTLASRYVNNTRVMFGLMNEPSHVSTEVAFTAMQNAINGVRESGAKQPVLVSGTVWSGVHSWGKNYYGTPNADLIGNLVDPEKNMIVEMHQYFDTDYGGNLDTCRSDWNTANIFNFATNWLRQKGLKGFLGEFGFPNNAWCNQVADSVLTYLDNNSDAWVGWTYWAAGPRWSTYMYSVEPNADGSSKPQTAILFKHLDLATPSSSSSVVSSTTRAPSTTATPSSTVAPSSTGSSNAVCVESNEWTTRTISCSNGQVININNALYGTPSDCPNIAAGSCNNASALSIVRGLCQGKASCSIVVQNTVFGEPCFNVAKHLAVSYQCVNAVTATTVAPSTSSSTVAPSTSTRATTATTAAPSTSSSSTTRAPSTTATPSSSTIAPSSTGSSGAVCVESNEWTTRTISCSNGQVISINNALYGTPSDCPNIAAGSCNNASALSIVRGLCQGKTSCSIVVQNSVFGEPCFNVAKHLAVSYQCVNPAPPSTASYCAEIGEWSPATLSCTGGKTVSVVTAFYGTPTGCPSPAAGTCGLSTLSTAKSLCDGKTSCQVWATNANFGISDPCPNIQKKFAASYNCV